MPEFSYLEWGLVGLIFIWTGFVRTGLGFGGAALGLPLMLLLGGAPLFWLPIIGIHLLLFSSLTISSKIKHIDWPYVRKSLIYILPASLIGVTGLISLPAKPMIIFIYAVALFYGGLWFFDKKISSGGGWVDKLFLVLGGYVAGTSLTGAPLIVAVYMQHVAKEMLRNSLFILWIILVSIKMSTFVVFGVEIFWKIALVLLPLAAIGHVIGLKLHEKIIENDAKFKRIIGGALVFISLLGLVKILALH
jgi:uncharacterized protein